MIIKAVTSLIIGSNEGAPQKNAITNNNIKTIVLDFCDDKKWTRQGILCKCECGEEDPNYEPPHVHNFVEGKCECGETDPNYKPEVKPDPDPEPQPKPEPEPAGGCKGGAIQNVFYLISALGLAFVLRKKRF